MSLADLFYSEDFLTFLLALLFIFGVVFLIINWKKHVDLNTKKDLEEVRTQSAKIVSKEQISNTLKYRVEFEYNDGRRKICTVDYSIASKWLVGDSGELSYRGERVIDFKKDV